MSVDSISLFPNISRHFSAVFGSSSFPELFDSEALNGNSQLKIKIDVSKYCVERSSADNQPFLNKSKRLLNEDSNNVNA